MIMPPFKCVAAVVQKYPFMIRFSFQTRPIHNPNLEGNLFHKIDILLSKTIMQ